MRPRALHGHYCASPRRILVPFWKSREPGRRSELVTAWIPTKLIIKGEIIQEPLPAAAMTKRTRFNSDGFQDILNKKTDCSRRATTTDFWRLTGYLIDSLNGTVGS